MPVIHRRQNYRNIMLHAEPNSNGVGVRRRDGSLGYKRWLGFVDVGQAKEWGEQGRCKPVLLEAVAVTSGDRLTGPWVQVPPGGHVQGCLINTGVYGVLVDGMPRIVERVATNHD